MLDGLLAQLLTIKWSTAARKRFHLWLCQFLLFLLISLIAYWSRWLPTTGTRQTNWLQLASELALVCFVFYYLWVITSRIVPQFSSRSSILRTISQAPEMSLFSATCLLILICIPLRLLGWHEAEHVVASLIMFTLPLKFLFFCRASISVGPFVVVIYKIVANDVICFIILLVIFVGGFSQCKYSLFSL